MDTNPSSDTQSILDAMTKNPFLNAATKMKPISPEDIQNIKKKAAEHTMEIMKTIFNTKIPTDDVVIILNPDQSPPFFQHSPKENHSKQVVDIVEITTSDEERENEPLHLDIENEILDNNIVLLSNIDDERTNNDGTIVVNDTIVVDSNIVVDDTI